MAVFNYEKNKVGIKIIYHGKRFAYKINVIDEEFWHNINQHELLGKEQFEQRIKEHACI